MKLTNEQLLALAEVAGVEGVLCKGRVIFLTKPILEGYFKEQHDFDPCYDLNHLQLVKEGIRKRNHFISIDSTSIKINKHSCFIGSDDYSNKFTAFSNNSESEAIITCALEFYEKVIKQK